MSAVTASQTRFAGRLVLALLLASLSGQRMTAFAQNAQVAPRIVVIPGLVGKPGTTDDTTQVRPGSPSANLGPPLFGQSWPHIGPDPAPGSRPPSRCPQGYVESSASRGQLHLVICIVHQLDLTKSYSSVGYGQQSYPNTAYAGGRPIGQLASSLPPGMEQARVNQCAGRPNYYACGRAGTECCAPSRDNVCFAGAYACAISPTAAAGTKRACCISR